MKSFSFLLILLSSSVYTKGQNVTTDILLNHSLLVVDSITYQGIIQSKFLKKIAFCYEKKMTNWSGFYLIGKDNYLEVFHPQSFNGSSMEVGETWICLASMRVNKIKKLAQKTPPFIEYDEDENYHYLSYIRKDSSTPITTWEMKEKQFESWTKKIFKENMVFSPVDYNSSSDSDSSSGFGIKNISGLDLKINPSDILPFSTFLELNGFKKINSTISVLEFSNQKEIIKLFPSKNHLKPNIFRIYFDLNRQLCKKTKYIGNSKLVIIKKKASWEFNLSER
jgi:hypothetical protein